MYDDFDLEDSSTLTARAFGTIAAIFGGFIALGSLVALFVYPRWLWIVLVVMAFLNTFFQSLVFVMYEGTLCTEEFRYDNYYWGWDDWYYPQPYYEDCYKANGEYIYKDTYDEFPTTTIALRQSNNSTNSTNATNVPTASPIAVPSNNTNLTSPVFAPSESPIAATSMPTQVPSQMPSYCYGYATSVNVDMIYYPPSGPGCELSMGAQVAIAAIILWFISGVLLLFRKPKSRPIVNCCNAGTRTCCGEPAYADMSSSSNAGATNIGANPDIQMVVHEVTNPDGSKRTVTSYEPTYKEKKTVVELVHPDGSSTVKTLHETIVHNKV